MQVRWFHWKTKTFLISRRCTSEFGSGTTKNYITSVRTSSPRARKNVPIMLFMLALHSHAHFTFRIVDEIKQGMDQRNKPLVRSLMVQISIAFKNTQYFIITHKLLSGLEYSFYRKDALYFCGPGSSYKCRSSIKRYRTQLQGILRWVKHRKMDDI